MNPSGILQAVPSVVSEVSQKSVGPLSPSHRITNTEKVFVQFLEGYLSQPDYQFIFQGTQKGFNGTPGLLLFAGPEVEITVEVNSYRAATTLAIETTLLLRPREEVLEIIKAKLDKSRAEFRQ
jgi:hypothetical protein